MGTCMALRMTLYAARMEMTFNIMFAAGSVYSLVIKHSDDQGGVYFEIFAYISMV